MNLVNSVAAAFSPFTVNLAAPSPITSAVHTADADAGTGAAATPATVASTGSAAPAATPSAAAAHRGHHHHRHGGSASPVGGSPATSQPQAGSGATPTIYA